MIPVGSYPADRWFESTSRYLVALTGQIQERRLRTRRRVQCQDTTAGVLVLLDVHERLAGEVRQIAGDRPVRFAGIDTL